MVKDLSSDVKFRRAMPGEMHLLASLATAAWKSAINTDTQSAGFDQRLYSCFLDFCLSHSNSIIVAEQDGRCVGWGAYIPDSDYISDLWIAPEHQGKSIGRALLLALINIIVLGGNEAVKIGTYASNYRAIEFYKKMGFIEYLAELEYSPLMSCEISKVRLMLKF